MLQRVLAAIWLLDGLLQYQSFMYTGAFGQMLAGAAAGNPGVIARPVSWNAALVAHHLVLLNTVFATIQLLLGLGIAYRPTVRVALPASIAWSLAVWWFGEGLGGVLTVSASPVSGAPGAVILHALLAVLLWPTRRAGGTAPCVAFWAVGARAARLVWLVLWASLAWFALTPANRAPQALHNLVAGMADGEPGWVTGLDNHAAAVSAGQPVAARAWTRRGRAGAGLAVSQLLTGIALAGILVPGLSILPDAVWQVVFAVVTACFAWCLWRESRGRGAAAVARGPYAPHLVQSAAMLCVFAALAGPSAPPAAYTAERLLLSPAVVKGCQVAIGVAMAFILIIMI